DEPAGRISVRGGRTVVEKRLTAQDRGRVARGRARIRELFETVGAERVIEGRQGFGLHLMGGCAIGTDPARSVVAPDFRVHGHRNLIVADSSVFPSAPGINPSLTIMALSELAAEGVLRDS